MALQNIGKVLGLLIDLIHENSLSAHTFFGLLSYVGIFILFVFGVQPSPRRNYKKSA